MQNEINAAQNNSKHRPSGPVQVSPSGFLEELADDGPGSCVLLVGAYLVVLCRVLSGPQLVVS